MEIINTSNWDEVNEKESLYIKEQNTLSPNGYNLKANGIANLGKNKTKLTEDVIKCIIRDLKNKESISKIAEKYNISRSYLSDINNGRCLRQENENYPL